MNRLRNQLNARRTDRFYGSKAKQIMRSLSLQQQDHFRSLVDRFLEKAVLYIEDKFDFNDQLLAHAGCLSLGEGQSLQWSELNHLLDKLALDVDEDKLYGDVVILNEVSDTIPKDLTLDKKWAYFFGKATESSELMKILLSPLNMASSQDRALQALSAELARLDRQITALLKKQDELLQQKSQLEASREVPPSVVAPAWTLRTPGDAVLTPTPAPPGPWERQRRRQPSRPSPPPNWWFYCPPL
ncbi:hypothetical protein SRHO_G00232980 [Serrasalmus rhombeus]